ncbi:ABC transporter ATP-binding protein [Streptomyces sp. NPDC057552]|uniref:ABC transporter ATP-binding protein n=1 Tax=Streptomyces sp. NPDC057552 TaxID=3350537 RepID=UPI00369F853B
MLSFESVGVRYPQAPATALDGVSFTVSAGECVVLGGGNGAGKSTVLRAAAGLVQLTEGRVLIGGSPAGSRPARSSVGFVADKPPLYDVLSPVEHIELLSALWQLPPAGENTLRTYGLEGVARRPVRTLSLGQRQRLALAVATLHRPELLLLDEPFNGLDAATTGLVRAILRSHLAAGGAVLVATHTFEPMDGTATGALRVDAGRLVDAYAGPDPLGELRRGLAAQSAADEAEQR